MFRQPLGLDFRKYLGVLPVFFWDHLFEGSLSLGLVGFSGELGGECKPCTHPEFITGIFNYSSFDPGPARGAIGTDLFKRGGWSGVRFFRATRKLHFARFPVDDGIDFLQPG